MKRTWAGAESESCSKWNQKTLLLCEDVRWVGSLERIYLRFIRQTWVWVMSLAMTQCPQYLI